MATSPKQLFVARPIDLTHPARADRLQDLVVSELRAAWKWHGGPSIDGNRSRRAPLTTNASPTVWVGPFVVFTHSRRRPQARGIGRGSGSVVLVAASGAHSRRLRLPCDIGVAGDIAWEDERVEGKPCIWD